MADEETPILHFHRRVHVRYTMEPECEHQGEMEGDLMAPEPLVAADQVAGLIADWRVKEIHITCENSESLTDGEDEPESA